jgi:hypothetical protein
LEDEVLIRVWQLSVEFRNKISHTEYKTGHVSHAQHITSSWHFCMEFLFQKDSELEGDYQKCRNYHSNQRLPWLRQLVAAPHCREAGSSPDQTMWDLW